MLANNVTKQTMYKNKQFIKTMLANNVNKQTTSCYILFIYSQTLMSTVCFFLLNLLNRPSGPIAIQTALIFLYHKHFYQA